ncbi:MAG: Ig-like domain-containing protein [Muribaculaceae bacterium]|nr:Ig-like domain-containing protein [Muribaculaceae bacterium]
MTTGATVNLTKKGSPTEQKVTYTSSNEKVITVSGNQLTAVAAGTATITAESNYGKSVSYHVTVADEVAVLSAVEQTASNAFKATFSADASKTITKDDIVVEAADGSSVLPVKSVEYSADGKSALVTLYSNFVNATAYKITCKGAVMELVAKVGAVSRIAIETASAEQNVETPIDFKLFDAENIDVTSSVSVDTTCTVTVSGDYSSANLEKASRSSITMNTVGAKADVTVTYNSNETGAQDISATQTITCVKATATQGAKLYANTTNINTKAGNDCAKFYLGLSDTTISVAVGNNTPNVYFCAKDANGNVISYDNYEVESSNDDVAAVATTVDSGKYAKITVTGNSVGSAQINVKATKNGADTYYTIPVAVTTVAEAASMTVSVDRPTMSNVKDVDYKGTITAKLFDKDGKEVGGSFNYELETTATNPITVAGNTVTAAGADAKTYTIKVTGADNNNNTKTFTKRVTVSVKNLVTNPVDGINLTYQIELDRTAIDENPSNTGDDSVKARLYATYNGLFAGYVRAVTGGAIVIADADAEGGSTGITASDATAITSVKVCAKFGTNVFGTTLGLVTADDKSDLTATGDVFTAVAGGAVTYDVSTRTSTSLAKTGTYTIEYSFTQNGKEASKTRTVTVTNTVFIPTVSVTSRTVDSLADPDIVKVLKTNVDMNNNNSDYESIANPVDASAPTATKRTVKSVEVVDNYGVMWTFVIPVNATFKTE